jgi:propionate CoA-transferase
MAKPSLHDTMEYGKIILNFIRFKLTEKKYDPDYLPVNLDSSLFVTAAKAVSMIEDGDTVYSAGLAAHCRCSIFYYVLRDRFLRHGAPRNLTWITTAAHGGRGKAPGTLEELALPGLISEYISSHVETTKAQLAMAEKGLMGLHTIPYGEITFLLEAQANGHGTVKSGVGLGTFLDPALGGGTGVGEKTQEKSYVERSGDALTYTLPRVDVALLVAPYADRDGNIYFKNAACITDHYESAMAAYRNKGKVIVAVSGVIERCDQEIGLASQYVSAIIVNPWNEQTGGVRQRNHFPMFTEGAEVDIRLSCRKVDFINRLIGVASTRSDVDIVLARLAAWLFTCVAEKGNLVNLGVGLPEKVGHLLFEHGLHNAYTFTTEAGAYGGVPASGIYFGAAIAPKKLKSSAWMFKHYKDNLDVSVFGFLQVDSDGNVNVSKRGNSIEGYVGPGGLINIAECAKTIVFVGHFMARARYAVKNDRLVLQKKGSPKFVDRVDEITFNGKRAQKAGKNVFYVTTVGIFRLTGEGLKLIRTFEGMDIRKDILENSTAAMILPEDQPVPVIPESIVVGKNIPWNRF